MENFGPCTSTASAASMVCTRSSGTFRSTSASARRSCAVVCSAGCALRTITQPSRIFSCARGRYRVPRGASVSPSVRVSRTTPTIVRQLLVSFTWPPPPHPQPPPDGTPPPQELLPPPLAHHRHQRLPPP